jgi:hypothetical protein
MPSDATPGNILCSGLFYSENEENFFPGTFRFAFLGRREISGSGYLGIHFLSSWVSRRRGGSLFRQKNTREENLTNMGFYFFDRIMPEIIQA